MSLEVSAAPISTHNATTDVNRRSANFHPSIWGDHFLAYASDFVVTDEKMEQRVQNLKEEVKRMLMAVSDKPLEKLRLIDAIQRLGVVYHFESEIDEILHEVHDTHFDFSGGDNNDDDLFFVALHFRLLRQQGYRLSCDVFKKYMDDEGKFKKSIIGDVRGMLSLYEATHLRVNGEDELDEALAFTTTHLRSVLPSLSSPIASQVEHALKLPIRKGLLRLEARKYMSIYQEEEFHNEVLLTFAKLDFNLLQKMHQKELSEITAWWKDLNFATKLPFARDRVVECYFWILGVYFEPNYVLARMMLTKVIALTSIIDDIYDVYGTIEELVIFTDAIERWDIGAMDKLPEYMQYCYQALLDVYSETQKKLESTGKSYSLRYAKEAMKHLVRSYYLEAEWCHKQYIPTMEEYMRVALVTSAYSMLATTSLIGMGNIVTENDFVWLSSQPKMVTASSIICRLMDDMVSHKFEQMREHVASSMECYMHEYGTTEEETRDEFNMQVVGAWKDINEECLHPTAVCFPILMRILNLSRVIDVLYKNEDGYTNAGIILKDFVSTLLIDSVPI